MVDGTPLVLGDCTITKMPDESDFAKRGTYTLQLLDGDRTILEAEVDVDQIGLVK